MEVNSMLCSLSLSLSLSLFYSLTGTLFAFTFSSRLCRLMMPFAVHPSVQGVNCVCDVTVYCASDPRFGAKDEPLLLDLSLSLFFLLSLSLSLSLSLCLGDDFSFSQLMPLSQISRQIAVAVLLNSGQGNFRSNCIVLSFLSSFLLLPCPSCSAVQSSCHWIESTLDLSMQSFCSCVSCIDLKLTSCV